MEPQKTRIGWKELSRCAGLAIVGAVVYGWLIRGLSISDPGVLGLLGIAAWLLGINIALPFFFGGERDAGTSSTPPDSSSHSDSSSREP